MFKPFAALATLALLCGCANPKPLDVHSGYTLGKYKVASVTVDQASEHNLIQTALPPEDAQRIIKKMRGNFLYKLENEYQSSLKDIAGPDVEVHLQIVHADVLSTVRPTLYATLTVTDARTHELIFEKKGVGKALDFGRHNQRLSNQGASGELGAGLVKTLVDITNATNYEDVSIQVLNDDAIKTLYPFIKTTTTITQE